jgi:hypothetical protein
MEIDDWPEGMNLAYEYTEIEETAEGLILIYIQQNAMLLSLFYLETDLHVSGGTSTHHHERKQLSAASGICNTVTATCRYRGRVGTQLMLPAAIVEELERSSNASTIAAGSSNGATNTSCCRYSCLRS